jgi:hypothetical protein
MGAQSAPSAAAIFTPAQNALDARQSQAEDLASRRTPETYQFDPYEVNKDAALLSRAKILNDREALRELYPEVFAGQEGAIRDIAGGTESDEAFVRNQALKSGLGSALLSGARVGGGKGSAGDAAVSNIFGKDILAYRSQRNAERLGLAKALQPDAAINPADAIAAREGSKQGAMQTRNDWTTYLTNLRMGNIQNQNNRLQQTMQSEQGRLNANAAAGNAATGQLIGAGTSVLAAGAVIL